MASIRLDVISIGTLSRNRLWNEGQPVRTPHATTTLIRTGKRTILVDPGLPPQALGARLYERTGLKPESVDTVFLTNFRPAHRAGIALFPKAKRLIHELEQQATAQQLRQLIDGAPDEDLDRKILTEEMDLLESLRPADDKLAPGVDLFPLFGYTPGQSGTATISTAGIFFSSSMVSVRGVATFPATCSFHEARSTFGV